jgi:hypothetical protein
MTDKNLIKKSIIPLVVFLSFGFSSFGQNALSTTGGHIKSTGGSTSFTVGQVAYVLKKGSGSYLNEGVQQVYTKKTTPIEELVYLKEVQLYPNPTQETFNLIISTKEDVLLDTPFWIIWERKSEMGIFYHKNP